MSTVASCVLVLPRRVSTHNGAASSMQRCSDADPDLKLDLSPLNPLRSTVTRYGAGYTH